MSTSGNELKDLTMGAFKAFLPDQYVEKEHVGAIQVLQEEGAPSWVQMFQEYYKQEQQYYRFE